MILPAQDRSHDLDLYKSVYVNKKKMSTIIIFQMQGQKTITIFKHHEHNLIITQVKIVLNVGIMAVSVNFNFHVNNFKAALLKKA